MAVYRVTFTKIVTYTKSIEVRAHGKNEATHKAQKQSENRKWEINETEDAPTKCELVED